MFSFFKRTLELKVFCSFVFSVYLTRQNSFFDIRQIAVCQNFDRIQSCTSKRFTERNWKINQELKKNNASLKLPLLQFPGPVHINMFSFANAYHTLLFSPILHVCMYVQPTIENVHSFPKWSYLKRRLFKVAQNSFQHIPRLRF